MKRPGDFSRSTMLKALSRQKNRCASCGVHIFGLGTKGRARHVFGEGSQAHHRKPLKDGGSDSLDNCVILCTSCHYSAHEGGNYRYGTVIGRRRDYPYFKG